ncbi:serine hydrolase [uncultured Paracoccus sp.]|uniref:serine hydrolase domain-containing protein n=1 Tax=uncultured Paracoccus sp. TaxID=189685 RepID=UPI002608D94A|nr:serine hydrolase [uncultured Paracoccus sp.]
MTILSRRRLMTTGAAVFAAPLLHRRAAFGQSDGLAGMAESAAALGQLRSLVIHRDGACVFARAFRGPAVDRPANIKSVSKTILGLLTGIAIDRGVITGPDQRVLPLLDRDPFGDARDSLTVGHLLSMQAGLDSTSGPAYGAWVSSRDWVDFALTRPLVGRPGGRFIYSTGGWHVLGAALARAARSDLHQLARSWLGEPLDIAVPPWIRDPQGRFMGGNDMAISPVALARIGDMVLAGGQIGGRRVVSRQWIQTSMQPRARSPFSGDLYGYGWFLTRHAGQDAAYARGYGGQMLVVVPGRQLAVAITSDPDRPARSEGFFGDLRQLLERIVAAA